MLTTVAALPAASEVSGLSAVLADSDVGKAGPVGLLVIIVLCLAVFALGRSMFTHLRRVPASFDEGAPAGGAKSDGAAPGTGMENDGDTG